MKKTQVWAGIVLLASAALNLVAEEANQFKVDRKDQIVSGADKWTGADDCSAQANISKTAELLIFRVTVKDDKLSDSNAENWNNDSVEIYLDIRDADKRDGTYQKGVSHMVICPALKKDAKSIFSFTSGESTEYIPDVKGVKVESKLIEGGYYVSVSYPINELEKAHGKLGDSMAFDIGVNDSDAMDEESERDTQMMLFGTDENWRNPSKFKVIKMSDVTEKGK